MTHREWHKGSCKFMVSDSASRVVGKRPCDRKPVKDDLCAFHQPEKVKARYEKLMARHQLSVVSTYPPERRSGMDRRAARPEAVAIGKRLVYNKATKRIEVIRHDGLVLDSFEPPQECDGREPHSSAEAKK